MNKKNLKMIVFFTNSEVFAVFWELPKVSTNIQEREREREREKERERARPQIKICDIRSHRHFNY